MSEVKWIKIATSLFDNDKMQFINSLKHRDTVFYLWVRVLTLAGKSNLDGALKLNQRIKYTDEQLASIFDRDLKIVKEAMQLFVDLEMLERNKNDVYIVMNWDKYQSSDKLAEIREGQRRRQQAYRDRKTQANEMIIEGNFKCAYCGEKATGVDHIIPKSKGGSDDPSNLISACISCNASKLDRPLAQFLNNHKEFNMRNIKFDEILKNKKLMSFLNYDKKTDRFEMKDEFKEKKKQKKVNERW